jgi:glycosyltransferase involved in cell wall biosynthesis
MTVRISIVTPSYNQAAFLERTLQSVLSQRDHIHQYVVLDGGSADGSVDIIRRCAPAGIDHWESRPDAGQGDAIKRGFAMCDGDVLHWLNSDDALLPGALQQVRDAFEREPSMDVLTGWSIGIDHEDTIVEIRRRPHDSPRWARLGYLRVVQPSCFFTRRVYESTGGIDDSLHCVLDTELWYRLMRASERWGGIDAYLAAYRLHAATKGATMHQQYRRERATLKQRYPEFTGRRVRHAIGRFAFYGSQFLSGRMAAQRRDERAFRGRALAEVFGPCEPVRPAERITAPA